MNLFAFLAVLAALIYLELAVHVLSFDFRSGRNRVFFLLSLSLFWYAFCQSFFVVASTHDEAVFWHRAGAVGWVLAPMFSLHFLALITGNRKLTKPFPMILYYLPALIFLPKIFLGGFFMRDVFQSDGIWHVRVYSESPWFWFYHFMLLVYNSLGVFFLIFWRMTTDREREKKQAGIVLWTFFLSIPAVYVCNILLPMFGFHRLPAFGYLAGLVFVAGIAWAIRRYRFLTLPTTPIPGEILMGLSDIILMLDSQGRVLLANRQFEEQTGIRLDKIAGLAVAKVLEDGESLEKQMDQLRKAPNSSSEAQVRFRDHDNLIRSYNTSISVLRNSAQAVIGFILVFFDVQDSEKDLAEFSNQFDISARELEIVRLLLQGCSNQVIADRLFISLYTVKTHVHRIYKKTGVRNKIELARIMKMLGNE